MPNRGVTPKRSKVVSGLGDARSCSRASSNTSKANIVRNRARQGSPASAKSQDSDAVGDEEEDTRPALDMFNKKGTISPKISAESKNGRAGKVVGATDAIGATGAGAKWLLHPLFLQQRWSAFWIDLMQKWRDGCAGFNKALSAHPELITGPRKRLPLITLGVIYFIIFVIMPVWYIYSGSELRAVLNGTNGLIGSNSAIVDSLISDNTLLFGSLFSEDRSSGRESWDRLGPDDPSPRFRNFENMLDQISNGDTSIRVRNHIPFAEMREGTRGVDTLRSPTGILLCHSAYFLWGVIVYGAMVIETGGWPAVTFTMWTWWLCTLRHGICMLLVFGRTMGYTTSPAESVATTVGAAIAGATATGRTTSFTSWEQLLITWVEILRFPVCAQHAIVFSIWWFVLVPVITFMQKSKEDKIGFLKWNVSPLLCNIHCLNIIFAFTDQMFFCGRSFIYLDLWIAFVFGLGYLVFYLGVLDAAGIHFYIILNPRTNWSVLSYVLILAVIVGLFHGLR